MRKQRFILHNDVTARGAVLANLYAFLSQLPETKSWEITIKRHVKTRSASQRNALFGVAYDPIMDFIGLRGSRDKEELHAYFCGEFFGWTEPGPLQRAVPVRTTTVDERGQRNEIDTQTAVSMYEFIQQRAAEQGIYVPDPDPMFGVPK